MCGLEVGLGVDDAQRLEVLVWYLYICVCGFSGGRLVMVVVVVWCACPCPLQLLQLLHVRQCLLQVSQLLLQVSDLHRSTIQGGGYVWIEVGLGVYDAQRLEVLVWYYHVCVVLVVVGRRWWW